ncbi:hypothetical protein ACQCVE_02735 [Metabacillus sp. 113a]|uniref:hypothetical protein n=1 Tax=Metabacillus sp. 113a TaxID=3404706 RepID=UPI003CF2AC68
MIVSEDLAEYDHIHPIRTGKRTYEIKKALKPGTYKAFDDLKPENGRYEVKPDVLQAGNKAKKYPPALKSDTDSKQSSGEFTVELNPKKLSSGVLVVLSFSFNKRTPEPYLGASGHVVILDDRLKNTFMFIQSPRRKQSSKPNLRSPACTRSGLSLK